jgi:predicted DNA-binding protein
MEQTTESRMITKKKTNTVAHLVRMSPELKSQLAQNAKDQSAAQSDIIRVAIEMYLAEYNERTGASV